MLESIRDPIHGALEVDSLEAEVVACSLFQRLRHVKQLGFADLAFPGATHSRYAHSVGAMWLAGRMWGRLAEQLTISDAEASRLMRIVRLAVLLHDVGHPPLSHASEAFLPPLAALDLPPGLAAGASDRRANHEDLALKLITDSSLTEILEREDKQLPLAVASLLAGRSGEGGESFRAGGLDCFPILRQLVSSELDADRMDYLLRDSFHAGVAYGKFDLEWLVRHIAPVPVDGRVYLALRERAIFGFDDFMIARHHMFLSVYYHRTSVCYQEMLARYFSGLGPSAGLPVDPEEFVGCDDVALYGELRRSADPWARRIVEHRPFVALIEVTGPGGELDLGTAVEELEGLGILHFRVTSEGVLSSYFKQKGEHDPPFYVVLGSTGGLRRMHEHSLVYRRYEEATRLTRIYCEPGRLAEAERVLGELVQDAPESRPRGG